MTVGLERWLRMCKSSKGKNTSLCFDKPALTLSHTLNKCLEGTNREKTKKRGTIKTVLLNLDHRFWIPLEFNIKKDPIYQKITSAKKKKLINEFLSGDILESWRLE